MKSYTDIEQSRKLAEILPLESADMCYRYYNGGIITGYGDCVLAKSFITGKNVIRENDLPCWSLAALLEHLRKHNLFPEIKDAGDYILMDITFYDEDEVVRKVISPVHFIRVEGKNILDACYEMILKLHELNLL